MCGIIGYVGSNDSVPFLLQGLQKLEYRGYDSAGVAICTDNGLNVIKKKGRLENLVQEIECLNLPKSNLGIGHTRWATHGSPGDENSHPQLSDSKNIAVVHNGIIENYIVLKEFLIKKGKKFTSDTDTEVIAQLIDYMYNGNIFSSVINAVNKLEGSFALGIICRSDPGKIIAVKKDSPLIIGCGENENYIASDIPAVLSKTNRVYRLKECEIAVITQESIKLYDFEGSGLDFSFETVDLDSSCAEKNGYEHFMLKEIMEQPDVIKKTVFPRIKENQVVFENFDLPKEYFEKLKKIYIVACGSAYHVGCSGKYVIEKLTGIPVEVDLASEFRYRSPIVDNNTLVITISQSGETADTLAALREAKKYNAKVLSIVNVAGSPIANESDYVFYTQAGPEIAVATTKAYSAQLCLIYLLALYLSKILAKIDEQGYINYLSDIILIPEKIKEIFEGIKNIRSLAQDFFRISDAFFIGRNLDYAACMEGSLKLKEISYVHSESYAAGELKHGTISLIEDNTLVIAVATQSSLIDKIVSNIREVKARGAKVIAITTHANFYKISEVSDHVIPIPKLSDIFMASLSVIPLQLFSYCLALLRECDIDKPRNLAKSVTVE
ncbi:MAG: glutamine--fructose-6-phosphate transaminase (isomerizing) [Oscillospiraceae bacterium]|jgi:glucosamine--fructose-6-phosphate aminotransferase (isomerizing)|nr:glutamine--fructose-6-phosphate transaminase (isomerizing) [Oscillospiraceae bacterium]